MLTVEVDAEVVETRLGAGLIRCPECPGVLRPWGFARSRQLRTRSESLVVRPRRARCDGCGLTQVLLPANVVVRRADEVDVIGAALAARAVGLGSRRIAGLVGRARSTVRGWLARFTDRAEVLRRLFTEVLIAVDPDPVLPESAGSMVADAVAAIIATGVATGRRWGLDMLTVSPWRVSVAITGGRLLSPDRTTLPINTSPPWLLPI